MSKVRIAILVISLWALQGCADFFWFLNCPPGGRHQPPEKCDMCRKKYAPETCIPPVKNDK